MLTLMFLVVAKKSRTFFSFPYSANKEVYKSWEDSQAASPNWPMEVFHNIHIMLSLGMRVS